MSKTVRLADWTAYALALLSIIIFWLLTKPPVAIWDTMNFFLSDRELHGATIYALTLLDYAVNYPHIIFPCAFVVVSAGWLGTSANMRIVFFFASAVVIIGLLFSIYLGFLIDEYFSTRL